MNAKETKTPIRRGDAAARYTDRFIQAARNTLSFMIRRRAALLGCLLLIVLVLGCVNLYESLYTSRVTLFLNYAQATQGLYPNGTRLSMYELKSEEVMERAIAYAGLTGQVEPEALASCLSIRNGNTSSVSGSQTFICTSYTITYTDRLRVPGRSASAMLSMVCKAYKDYFFTRYTDKQTVLGVSDSFFEADDYLMQLDLLRIKANQLESYVSDRIKENKNFVDPVSGLSFTALEQKLSNFLRYDIANLSAYLLENGVARDRENLLAILNYKIRMNTLSFDRAIAAYQVDNEGIGLYDEAMSAVVMIPTTDAGQRYYMSRTMTGMDYLADHADAKLTEATQTHAVIEYDSYVAEKIGQSTPTAAQTAKADAMIGEMQARLREIAAQIRQVDNAFVHSEHREYISFRSNDPSFLTAVNLPSAAVCALLAMIGLMLARLFYDWIRLPGEKGARIGR